MNVCWWKHWVKSLAVLRCCKHVSSINPFCTNKQCYIKAYNIKTQVKQLQQELLLRAAMEMRMRDMLVKGQRLRLWLIVWVIFTSAILVYRCVNDLVESELWDCNLALLKFFPVLSEKAAQVRRGHSRGVRACVRNLPRATLAPRPTRTAVLPFFNIPPQNHFSKYSYSLTKERQQENSCVMVMGCTGLSTTRDILIKNKKMAVPLGLLGLTQQVPVAGF